MWEGEGSLVHGVIAIARVRIPSHDTFGCALPHENLLPSAFPTLFSPVLR
jgi:hypothetical protein